MTQELISFASFQLAEPILRALSDMQIETPSPVQLQTIPSLLEGRDVIAQAQTGTGKTAAFALPILQRLSTENKHTQALILAPTRELAIQVADQFETLSKHMKGVEIAVLCGGQDYRKQLLQLKGGAQIVVGTPGRILDHIERKTLNLGQLSTFVLDEADEMLRMGFIEDVESILAILPAAKQMALFSATIPSRIRQITTRYLNNPVSVEIRMETATVKSIEQRFLFASMAQKPDALLRILSVEEFQGVIVFVRTKTSSEEVATLLQQHQHRAMAIHGDLTQPLRERIITQFRQGSIDVLVATDVAARGLDVERVTHVINYDVPFDCETYVHRIGRTGRAGRSGVAVLFLTPKESRLLTSIERHTRQRIEKIVVPNDHMIQMARQERFLTSIRDRLTHENLAGYRSILETLVNDNGVDALDVAATLALILNQDKPWHRELNFPKAPKAAKEGRVERSGRESRGGERESLRFSSDKPSSKGARSNMIDTAQQAMYRIDVGRVHGVKPGNIVGAIANEAGLQSRSISGIKIHDDHSTVFLPKSMTKESLQQLQKAWVCGRQLKLTSVA